ncbi:MAG: hypothetical protein CSA75_01840 [Sorangium cellulosum]|nr:MAG: hypothetical protein CSA75_01840 [Sorangium cellulosum]
MVLSVTTKDRPNKSYFCMSIVLPRTLTLLALISLALNSCTARQTSPARSTAKTRSSRQEARDKKKKLETRSSRQEARDKKLETRSSRQEARDKKYHVPHLNEDLFGALSTAPSMQKCHGQHGCFQDRPDRRQGYHQGRI